MITVKLGKGETAHPTPRHVMIGGVYEFQLKGDGGKSSMTRRDVFSGRQDGGKTYIGRVVGIALDAATNTPVLTLDCSAQYRSIVRQIKVSDIALIEEVYDED